MPPVIDALVASPILLLVVAAVMRAALAYQRGLTWPEYRTLHGLRRLVFPVLDRREPFGYGVWVSRKGGRDDGEFVQTEWSGLYRTAERLRCGGASLHLLSSLKRRPDTHGDPLSAAHVVWSHADGSQTEAYLFENGDGTTDVYAHHEASVTDPAGHLTGRQQDGDPRGVVTSALEPSWTPSEMVP